MFSAVAVVCAAFDNAIDCPMPVVRPEYVWRNCVLAAPAVDDRSSSAPVVVLVSTEVDEILASDPPFAMTDVV